MLTNYLVVQKINLDSRVHLFQAQTTHLLWHFETHGSSQGNAFRDIFPFVLHSDTSLSESLAGSETEVTVRPGRFVVFNDKYAVPGAIVIGILFPQKYVPTIFKFIEQPTIPAGLSRIAQLSVSPPGHFDIFYNQTEKRCAIVFMISSPAYFEFRCVARYSDKSFPHQERSSLRDDALAMTLDVEKVGKAHITREDLRDFSHFFRPETNLDDISDQMNRLIELTQTNVPEESAELSKVRKSLAHAISGLGVASSLIQVLDSYYGAGVVQKLVAKIIAYFIL